MKRIEIDREAFKRGLKRRRECGFNTQGPVLRIGWGMGKQIPEKERLFLAVNRGLKSKKRVGLSMGKGG